MSRITTRIPMIPSPVPAMAIGMLRSSVGCRAILPGVRRA